ncbi:fibrinogen C domain-containing protein 1 isoform X1 [Lepisosteus oculatus]|uniref:Fibrinogen C domain containing 1a n=2 Tax=Lepisosteus oculatus TaxID=7918 RepID=W5MH65_LEPOC|nr:PREDICTED: fibrinogen C domain-containing protein 1 isoform X1 [Lepisosteus oculatus]XP_015222738.1 PREDICTED: fibrinogen C domain-containing protein 1 isoform X1 [Lepisosteus oculatus]
MINDRWKIMNSVSELEDGQQHKPQTFCACVPNASQLQQHWSDFDTVRQTPQRMSCGYLLCTILLFVAVLLAVTVTGTILFMNHYHAPVTDGPPLISTNQEEGNALVTVEKGDGSRINIFIDPNCPDYNSNFLRLEGVQTSLLHSLTDHDSDLKTVKGQDRALLVNLAEEMAKLSAHAGQLKMDYEALRRGQGSLGQELNTLQTEQGRLIQLLSESQINMVKVVNSVSDALNSMQKEQGGIKTRLKADLQRAPTRGTRPRGCANGSRPRDCSDIYMSGQREDGIYSVFPTHYPAGFQVFCDMTTDGGGWTVFQRREDGSVNFFKGWDSYREGFGKITGEHWLGLKRIHALTIQANYELRIDLEDFENSTAYAQYSTFGVGLFSVDPDEDGYPLTIADYSGTAGDSLLKHNGMKFTTKDRDNDHSENNCASFYHGAWWYRNCHTSNLNGQYLKGHHTSYADGIEWSSWTGWQYSLKLSEMKIRPTRDDSK